MMSALEGGRGGPGKAAELRELSKRGCMKMRIRGRGSKSQKI